MKRAIASALTLFCVACGGSDDAVEPGSASAEAANELGDDASGGNEPPVIVRAVIEPENAGASDALSLEVVVRDPEQDRVRTTVEWYRNGELVEDLVELTVPEGQFSRGDRVYAIIYATDGTHDVSAQTPALSLGNAAPRVKSLRVTPERATALDMIQVEADVSDDDGDRVELSYRWLRNGVVVPNATSARLAPGLALRGDSVIAQVNASDGNGESGWIPSKPLQLANSAPSITTQPNYELAGSGQYSYEVAAKDPDGDSPLRYEIVQGPPGMRVDIGSGLVTWRVPADAKGVYPIEIAVSDPHGGKTTQSYSLSVDWAEGEKDAKGAKPATKAAAKAAGEARETGSSDESPAASGTDDEGDEDYTDQDQEEGAEEEEF